MGDTNRDTELDRKDDPRTDLEQVVGSRSDAAEAVDGGPSSSPLEPTGTPDGVSGTAGEVKNQDQTAQ
ncbi:hypothetical protein TPR58_17770 [Sphingomonas sp. HF-S3]|uniref:Uncharacterized protein n=1 Tax=Sphingomonas rustica TaxID=3103142 RepID=A0ABV0BBU0_9SPHN